MFLNEVWARSVFDEELSINLSLKYLINVALVVSLCLSHLYEA